MKKVKRTKDVNELAFSIVERVTASPKRDYNSVAAEFKPGSAKKTVKKAVKKKKKNVKKKAKAKKTVSKRKVVK